MIAVVCGNVSIWKPSEKAPLSAVACFKLMNRVFAKHQLPEGIMSLIVGDVKEVGEPMTEDPRVSLISATGSTAMGKKLQQPLPSVSVKAFSSLEATTP